MRHSLCLLDGLGHGEEDAVDADGEHDDVIEVLQGCNSIDIMDCLNPPLNPKPENASLTPA